MFNDICFAVFVLTILSVSVSLVNGNSADSLHISCDKRVTQCQFGYSESLVPTESAIKETRFKTAHA